MSRFSSPRLLRCALILAVAAPCAVQAHPGHGLENGFGQGMLHPLSGLDHLLAMVAVGLWAAQLGGRARWVLPAGFVAVMSVGALLGQSGMVLPGAESLILASVLVLGLAVASARRAPLAVSAALTAVFAIAHGWVHGAEMSAAAAPGLFFGGFLMATALLLLAGSGAGYGAAQIRGERWLRWAGAGIAASGLPCLAA